MIGSQILIPLFPLPQIKKDWCNEPDKDDASCNPDINPAIPDCPQAGPEVCGEPEIEEEMVVEDDTSPPDD